MGKTADHCCGQEGLNEEKLLEELDGIIESHRDSPGALIPVLQITQNMFGYLPETALKSISRGLGISYSEVAGVVSFYSFFSTVPRGRHTVRVCLGTACYVRGGKELLETFRRELGIEVGSTTEDRMFSLEVGRCFGACGLAPVVVVDDTVHQRVRPSKVPELLARYRMQESAESGGSAESREQRKEREVKRS